ncbi:glycoside hydrolase family 127 protein [candidate division KSB1 bacterium]|nr:glycoside hydrolase family 127 protein [candidate division KSB1 bacterium]
MSNLKKLSIIVGVLCMSLLHCDQTEKNQFYPTNQAPLLATRFVKLPLGSIHPQGWLKDQLTALSQGLTGHLDEFWPDLMHSAWKGGDGEAWERNPYYLDGLVPLAYLLEDSALIAKTKPWLEWMLQSGQPNGWFGPAQNQDRWPLAVALKVVQQYHEATQDPRALTLINNYFRYLKENPPDWPDSTWRGVRAMEHAVTGYWLYRRTGNPDVLAVNQSIFENSFDWTTYFTQFPWDSRALAEKRIPLNWQADGLTAHVVNVAMATKYPGLWYQQSGDEKFKQAVYQGLANLDLHHGQVGGRFSGDEHLSGKQPTQGTELCAVVEFMFSLENLIEILGEIELADRLELLAYNALPGTMTPDCWAHQYDQQANQVLVSDAPRAWSTNGNTSNVYGLMPNYPCCLANLHQGWPKLVQNMWLATHDQGLAALVYGPCVVQAKVGKNVRVKITTETQYPFGETVKFVLDLPAPAEFPLYFRIPAWATEAQLLVKGKLVPVIAGQFAKVTENWQPGEEIQLTLPMKIQIERRFNQAVAIRRGPLYYSLRVGKAYQKIKLASKSITSIDYLGTVDWAITATTPWNYALRLDLQQPDASFQIESHPLSRYPFSDAGEMIYDPASNTYQAWPESAPVVLKVPGQRLPEWGMAGNSAADPPQSPVLSTTPLETMTLVPYGCTRLRISEFPVVK